MLKQIAKSGLAMLALIVTSGLAQSADEPKKGSPLISHEKLQESLKDPKVRLLDARPKADYDKGHISGAVWVDLKALQALTKPATVKDEAAWTKALTPLGINKDIQVVFVYDNARQHDASRVWWSLAYAGVPHVGLVDGGFGLWEKEKRPVSTDSTQVTVAEFKPQFHDKHLASRDEVAKGDVQVLDSRSADEYTGEAKPKNPNAVLGHIPGARNVDGYSLVDADGRFLDKDAHKSRFTEAGFTADKPVIVYSNGGNRSAIVIFALERIGVPSRHYVGGVSDWARQAKLAVVAGKNPKN